MAAKKFRKQIWFEGRVQGVGFRYKAVQLSRGYDVTGFVKNLDGGRVQLVASGEEAEVGAFALELKEVMADYIRDTFEKNDETELRYKGFQIEL